MNVIRRRFLVIAAWLAVAGALAFSALGLEGQLDPRARVSRSEAVRTEALLAREFDTPLAEPTLLVIEGLNPEREAGEAEVLRGLLQELQRTAPDARLITGGDELFMGEDGNSVIVLIDAPASAVAGLRETTDTYFTKSGLRVRTHWTSEALINDEMRIISARDADEAEMLVLPLALLVLLIAFGSITAGVTPVVIGVLSVTIARGALALIDGAVPLSLLTANVTTMLGLGLAVDYALLVISRFREELAHASPHAAALATAKRAGGTVLLSGVAVGIALAALILAPINEVQSIGIAGVVVVATSVAVCATLLPAALSLIGTRIDFLMPLRRRFEPLADRLWTRWARLVFKRPATFALLSAAPLLVLALSCTRLDISLPRGEWLPPSAEAREAMHALDGIGRTGLLQSVQVVARLDARVPSEAGWNALSTLEATIAADPRVEATRSPLPFALMQPLDTPLAPALRELFVSRDGHSVLIAVTPRADLELHELSQLVRDLRAAPHVRGITELSIGGAPALTADYVDTVTRWFVPVAVLILIATFILLAIGLRSILLPLKAVALNLLSVAAALGAMTLVFQDGAGAHWLGLDGPSGAVFPIIPILVFSIVFGLSMDYEVFLFSRVVEAHRNGASDLDAITIGLRATAGVITSAASLMIIVFGAFMLGDFLLMKMLGFSLAFAILIDAVLVRMVLGLRCSPSQGAGTGGRNAAPLPRASTAPP